MVFSSPVFLFLFLPMTLLCYALASIRRDVRLRNAVLLIASIVFYGYGGFGYLGLFFVSIFVNWKIGLILSESEGRRRRLVFWAGIAWNLGILIVFKYLNLLGETFASLGGFLLRREIESLIPQIVLPIGISFFTFQIMSYLIDVYWNRVPCQKSLSRLALYIMLFPQLIAGPIVRYIDVETEIGKRESRLDDVYEGVFRFMCGFAKKILLANTMGKGADLAFGQKPGMGMIYAWTGIFCYSLQIYLDFWAYSDMAIGLGRIFGFHFPENFNHPYLSKSVAEFWRRWHISLSSWFRDYVYIPLGGSRCSTAKNCRNYLIVFALTGIWHGASWNFLFWGLYFACFLIVERLGFRKILERLPAILRHLYTLIVVGVGWVFFRAETCSQAIGFLREMCSMKWMGSLDRELAELMAGPKFILLSVISILCCTPFFSGLRSWLERHHLGMVADLGITVVFFLSVCEMMASGYNPFIYFRF